MVGGKQGHVTCKILWLGGKQGPVKYFAPGNPLFVSVEFHGDRNAVQS